MRIHIIDPAFVQSVGHHVEWDLLIARELVKRGHEVQLFCNAKASAEAMQAFAKYGSANPLFQHFPYITPESPVHELSLFIDVGMNIEFQLRKLPPADLWLWPTMYAPDLLGCAIANAGVPISGFLHMEPSAILPYGDVWWEYAFKKADLVGLKLNLATTTRELGEIYSGFSPRRPIRCTPILQDGLLANAPKDQMRKVGIFGQQRREKGADLIPALITMLLAEGYEVVLQDSQGRPEISASPNLTTLGYVDNFAQEISLCDLILLPYDPDDYRVRLSAVAAEALASGVPVAAPAGTSIESLVRETGAGTLFSEHTAESILGAVADAKQHFTVLAEAAFKTSQVWSSKHGPSHFVDSLLEGRAN